MKASDLRDLSVEELRAREKDVKEELFNLRFQHATGQLENTMRIPQLRKDLARMKTILREKERADGSGTGGSKKD
jgi:large subunit ribosomal protein L29